MIAVSASAVMAADKVLNEDTVRPGLLGLGMFLALAVATFFLWRSMNKQLKKVDENYAEKPEPAQPAAAPAAADEPLEVESEASDPEPLEPPAADPS